MAPAKDIKKAVDDLLLKLEDEGVRGVRAWFAERPDVVVALDFGGGWEVVIGRGRIVIKMTLDKDFNVTSVKVDYA